MTDPVTPATPSPTPAVAAARDDATAVTPVLSRDTQAASTGSLPDGPPTFTSDGADAALDGSPAPSYAEPAGAMPPLLRRPRTIPEPRKLAGLKGLRNALLGSTKTVLDADAAAIVGAGVVSVDMVRTLLTARESGAAVDLLEERTTSGGIVHLLPKHDRFVDLGVLTDLRNGRYGHLLLPATALAGSGHLVAPYTTLNDGDGSPMAILTIDLPNREALADAVRESMRNTLPSADASNDYTASVLQKGVDEPLLLFVLRVRYDDGTLETYLMCGDGNSRLCSLWKARTGGTIDDAAEALVTTVIGPVAKRGPNAGERIAADTKAVRSSVAERARLLDRTLRSPALTAEAVTIGHTLTVPARVVVGIEPVQDPQGDTVADLAVAKDDLVTAMHVLVTPWEEQAQHEQALERVFRQAHTDGVLDDATYAVVTGTATRSQMHAALGLPPHPLWATAVPQHALLSSGYAYYSRLLREQLSLKQAKRDKIGGPIGTVALAPYRGCDGHERALRAFAGGGTITDLVWGTGWSLTRGSDPVAVLEDILGRALNGETHAIAELTVLGGTAAILSGLLTADRGSKESLERTERTTPYRSTPPRLLQRLTATAGGRRMLHSIARAFVLSDGSLPKAFHTETVTDAGGQPLHRDGDPVVDGAGAHENLSYEFDVFAKADPQAVADARARNGSDGGGGTGSGTGERAPEAVQREKLDKALKDAYDAVRALRRLQEAGQSAAVWGTAQSAEVLRKRAESIQNVLTRYAPQPNVLDDDLDDDLGIEL